MADFRSKSAILVRPANRAVNPIRLLAMFRDEANYSSATCGTLDNGIGSNTFCWMTPVAVTWLERSVKRPFSEPVRAWVSRSGDPLPDMFDGPHLGSESCAPNARGNLNVIEAM